MQKRNKLVVFVTVGVISILGIIGLFTVKHNNNEKVLEPKEKTNMIAMYIEDDSGEYKLSSSKEFPKEGYILNLEKSTCTNGGVLSQDSMTKAISLRTGNFKSECNLYFDKEQKRKPLLIDYIMSKKNAASITNYTDGNTGEMYTFSHPATKQTKALTDYRYIGANPNNWIRFNDEDWRIIGVFTVETESGEKKQLIKIIRNESIGRGIPWDMARKTEINGVNEWSEASLKTLLNGDYYNTEESFSYTHTINGYPDSSRTIAIPKGLNATARDQIENVKWYLGGSSTVSGLGGPDYYAFERGTTVYSGHTTNIKQRVGLIYPSDYVYTYANGVDEKCYTDGYNCKTDQGGIPSASWLYNSSGQWTQAPGTSLTLAFHLVSSGAVVYTQASYDGEDVHPAVYLTSNIVVTDGDGTEGNPLIITKGYPKEYYEDSITNVYLNSWGNELSGHAGKRITSFDNIDGALLFANETWGIPSEYTIDQVTVYSPGGAELATYYQRTWEEDNVWHARLSDYLFNRHVAPDLDYIGGEEILKQQNGGLKFVIIVKDSD